MKTCRQHGPACQSHACNMHKPHLRLHYNPTSGSECHWHVAYVRGPSNRIRHRTYWHETSNGALHSARAIWWGVSL